MWSCGSDGGVTFGGQVQQPYIRVMAKNLAALADRDATHVQVYSAFLGGAVCADEHAEDGGVGEGDLGPVDNEVCRERCGP